MQYTFNISEAEEGERIDRYLAALNDSMSRSYLQKLLRDGQIRLEGDDGASVLSKASYRIRGGDRILLDVPEAVWPPLEGEDIPLDILYEDEHLLVVNKPKGMVTHPAPGHHSHTLVHALLHHCRGSLSGIGGVLRPGIVHRLDRDTTGALVVCKNDAAHRAIARQLQERKVERLYLALVCGLMTELKEGTINAPIGRHPKDRKKMAVLLHGSDRAREAITHFRVRKLYLRHPALGLSYIECRLETGRTHQIRVHMAHIGRPVLGDTVYGNKRPDGILSGVVTDVSQTLHAATVGFVHPATGEHIRIEAPLPGYFTELLARLENENEK